VLAVMLLEHLLLLSMLQNASGTWKWGPLRRRPPRRQHRLRRGCNRYRDRLADQSTFSSMTVEEKVDAGVLPARTATALRKRYIPG